MSLTLPTFPANSVINATLMQARVTEVERYINEEMIAADRSTLWMTSNHVYRPDFFVSGTIDAGGIVHGRTILTSGESSFAMRSDDSATATYWSYYLGDTTGNGLFPVPGLCRTIQIPENIYTNAGHRTRVFASFYVYEYGGDDGNIDESAALTAGTLDLLVDGVAQGINKPIHKGTSTGGTNAQCFYSRKQVSFIHALDLNSGIHDIGVAISPTNTSSDEYKHLIGLQGAIIVRNTMR